MLRDDDGKLDWKNIGMAIALLASGWASVRGEVAKNNSENARDEAVEVVKEVEKDADNKATAVLNVLATRMEELEAVSSQVHSFVLGMNERDKYWERVLWELYRRERGPSAARRIVAAAPPKPDVPRMGKEKPPAPRSAAAAQEQYIQACKKGDEMCASPLK